MQFCVADLRESKVLIVLLAAKSKVSEFPSSECSCSAARFREPSV